MIAVEYVSLTILMMPQSSTTQLVTDIGFAKLVSRLEAGQQTSGAANKAEKKCCDWSYDCKKTFQTNPKTFVYNFIYVRLLANS